MPVVKCKPTSPGRRAPLTASKTKTGGRNNKGRITRRHQGGGHKQRYRIIDFKRNKDDIEAKIERLEYDPNRSANIALLLYADGERKYIIAPAKVAEGDTLVSGEEVPIKVGVAVAPPSVKFPIQSILCVLWAKLAPSAGEE